MKSDLFASRRTSPAVGDSAATALRVGQAVTGGPRPSGDAKCGVSCCGRIVRASLPMGRRTSTAGCAGEGTDGECRAKAQTEHGSVAPLTRVRREWKWATLSVWTRRRARQVEKTTARRRVCVASGKAHLGSHEGGCAREALTYQLGRHQVRSPGREITTPAGGDGAAPNEAGWVLRDGW